jgi:hypothetical protein
MSRSQICGRRCVGSVKADQRTSRLRSQLADQLVDGRLAALVAFQFDPSEHFDRQQQRFAGQDFRKSGRQNFRNPQRGAAGGAGRKWISSPRTTARSCAEVSSIRTRRSEFRTLLESGWLSCGKVHPNTSAATRTALISSADLTFTAVPKPVRAATPILPCAGHGDTRPWATHGGTEVTSITSPCFSVSPKQEARRPESLTPTADVRSSPSC